MDHAEAGPVETPARRETRRPLTIRRLMTLVGLVALLCGAQAALRNHVRSWEARRVRMDFQRDLTSRVLGESIEELAAPTRGNPPGSVVIRGPSTGTREWSIEVETMQRGGKLDPARVRISGANGEFALGPITVEVLDPALEGPWLDRLLAEYRDRGWPHVVARGPDARPSAR